MAQVLFAAGGGFAVAFTLFLLVQAIRGCKPL